MVHGAKEMRMRLFCGSTAAQQQAERKARSAKLAKRQASRIDSVRIFCTCPGPPALSPALDTWDAWEQGAA